MNHPNRRAAPTSIFQGAVRYFPMVCVNILVQKPDGTYLYLLRKNNPAKGQWWVPGGRLVNGERFAEAMTNILFAETGMEGTLAVLSPEFQEELWPVDAFDAEDWQNYERGTTHVHYVSAVGLVRVPQDAHVVLDDQSQEWKWSREGLNDHRYMKGYFEIMERAMGGSLGE